MGTLQLTVEGMRCGGCSDRLRRSLAAIDGVLRVDIDLGTKRVTVDFDQERVRVDAIREHIMQAGFSTQ